jgi:hypothetical protein
MALLTLWLFVITLGLDLGAGLYEARIVVPLWAGGVPETLAAVTHMGGWRSTQASASGRI